MNKSHKTIWNASLRSWVAVAAHTRTRGKRSSSAIAVTTMLTALCAPVGAQVVTVTGDYFSSNPVTGSPWNAGPVLTVGNTGSGSVSVTGGGRVTAEGMYFGTGSGGVGILNIDGAGSVVNQTSNFASFFVGGNPGAGSASVTVQNGGTLNTADTFVGTTGATGTLTVTGVGSSWNESFQARIGSRGTGTVNILNGATATTSQYTIVGSVGLVNVSGSGSVWNPGSLTIGTSPITETGSGTVTLSNGGVINAPWVYLAYNQVGFPASSATLNIGAAAGSAAAAPGTLNTANLYMGFDDPGLSSSNTSTLNLNHTSLDGSYVFAPAISSPTVGTATINQIAGNTSLTGDSSGFSGATDISGGTLRVNGTLGNAASTVNVSNGGTIGGAGTIGGSVAISNGNLAPGNSPGTLTINGNLTLAPSSQLNYELGAANTVGGALNDLTVVNGNLTLDGTLNVTQSAGGTFGAGIYRLINYSGTLTDNGLALGSMPASSVNYVQTAVPNQVNLINSNGLTLNYWDGDAGIQNDGVISGGNGTWLSGPTGSARWTQADGLINAPYQNPSFAIFTGAPGTVTVDNSLGQVAVTGMQFATSGYRIQGGDISLAAGTDAIRVGDGTSAGASTTATIASALIGAGKLDKVDAGTLVLAGNNTYTGGTSISGGTLQLGNGGTSGSIVGDIDDNATLAINRSDVLTLSGAISGTGMLNQIGSGTTILGGVNTYSGGTTIASGTLAGSATSFGSGAITDNAALVIDQPTNAALANAINGTGSFLKTGAGVLSLTGNGSLSGATTVSQGTLAVNGSLAASAVTVASGATLAGTGTVGATTLQSGASIAPGNGSIGTLTINGNYIQAAGATYQVKVDSSTMDSSDRVNVSGSATLASGSILNVSRTSNSAYMVGSKYTVLSATGGVTGTYSLSGDTQTAFVQLTDSYDANNVYLSASQIRSFESAALTPNQIATAGGLSTLPNSNLLHNAVAFLPTDSAARAAFDQLSGEQHASVQTVSLEDSRFVREAANARLLGAFCAPGANDMKTDKNVDPHAVKSATACVPSTGNVAWAQVFGSTGRIDSDGNAAQVDRDISGFFVGADTMVSGGWRVGGLGGYSRSSMNASNGAIGTDNYHLGAYGGNEWNGTDLRLGASYTWQTMDSQRTVAFPGYLDRLSAKYDGSTAQVFGEIGHRFDMASGVAIEPFAGLAYVNVKIDGFGERGGLAALTGQSASVDTTFSTLGARVTATLNSQTSFRGMLGWRHAFSDVTPTSTNAFAGSQPFTVGGVPLAQNVGVVEAGVETLLRPDLKLSASYSGQFGSGVRDHGIKAGLDYKF